MLVDPSGYSPKCRGRCSNRATYHSIRAGLGNLFILSNLVLYNPWPYKVCGFGDEDCILAYKGEKSDTPDKPVFNVFTMRMEIWWWVKHGVITGFKPYVTVKNSNGDKLLFNNQASAGHPYWDKPDEIYTPVENKSVSITDIENILDLDVFYYHRFRKSMPWNAKDVNPIGFTLVLTTKIYASGTITGSITFKDLVHSAIGPW